MAAITPDAALLAAAKTGDTSLAESLLLAGAKAFYQDETDGQSVLMAAASAGALGLVRTLLAAGAPWNAVDRSARCAGDYALAASHQAVVDEIVSAGVRAELLFAALANKAKCKSQLPSPPTGYIQRDVRYTEAGDALLDDEGTQSSPSTRLGRRAVGSRHSTKQTAHTNGE